MPKPTLSGRTPASAWVARAVLVLVVGAVTWLLLIILAGLAASKTLLGPVLGLALLLTAVYVGHRGLAATRKYHQLW